MIIIHMKSLNGVMLQVSFKMRKSVGEPLYIVEKTKLLIIVLYKEVESISW